MVKTLACTSNQISEELLCGLYHEGKKPALILGFVSPHLDFKTLSRQIKNILGDDTKLVLTTTAGELCASEDSLYRKVGTIWDNIVLQSFSNDMIEASYIASIPLENEDIRANTPTKTHKQRIDKIVEHLRRLKPPFQIDYRDTIAYTLIDGRSKSENFFMEAVYESSNLPCLFVGANSGGKLDVADTSIFDDFSVVQNHATITLIKLKPEYRFGIFKSQNFEKTDISFTIYEADMINRSVSSILEKDGTQKLNLVDALCKALRCEIGELENKLADYALGVEVANETNVRSIFSIDKESKEVCFYCDVAAGDELFLLKKIDFLEATHSQYAEYAKNKPTPIGAILNDCVRRRVNNAKQLDKLESFKNIPAAGFSTFGELLGVNTNESLTAVLFYKPAPNEPFCDDYIDNFVVKYASFRSYYLRRYLTENTFVEKLRLSERSLRRSNEFIETTLNAIPDPIFVKDREHRFVTLNDACCELIGLPREELLGKSDYDFFPKEEADSFWESDEIVFESKQEHVAEESITDANGNKKIIHTKKTPYSAPDEQKYIIGAIRDITKLKLYESKIQKSEQGLREAQRISKVGSWEMDFSSSKVHWSDEAYSIFEVSKELFAASYDAFLALIHPEDVIGVDYAFYKSLQDKTPFEKQYRLWMKDGRIKHIHTRSETTYNEHGNPVCAIGTLQDVTEQKCLEERLVAREMEFRSLAENSPDPIFRYDRSGRRIYVNPVVERYTQRSSDSLLGASSAHNPILEKSEALKQEECIHRVLQTKTATETEAVFIAPDSKKLFFHIKYIPEFGQDGEINGVLGIASDITARKEFELKLIEAENAAKAANKAKSDFLANMSHEIRTPLNAIYGMSNLLLNSDIGAKYQGYTQNIITASDTLLALIGDVLDFSKIEAGKMSLMKEPIDISKLLHELGSMFAVRAKEKRLEFEINIDEMVPKLVIGDKLRIKQIVINLLGNALKFTHHGYIQVSASVYSVKDNGIGIEIGVKDSGIGITDEQQKGLFGEFFQANLSNTKLYGGTGLGLAISKKIAELLGGEIGVESEMGVGSYFYAKIPFGMAGAEDADFNEIRSMSLRESKGILKGKNILIVDDNTINREMLAQLLAYLGASTKEAVNGVAAVSMMLKDGSDIDMILMDIQMPIMDGFEATKRIRAAGKTLPILALSADITAQTIENAGKCGMDGYLSKPLEHDKLLKYMIRHFGIVVETSEQEQCKETIIDFPALSSVDIVRGLGIFNNDAEAYASILKKLSVSINENMAALRKQLDKSDMNEAKKTAHAMKGACSNLGVFRLSEAWLKLESAIRYDDKNEIADSIIVIENAMTEYRSNMEILDTICFDEKSEEKNPLEPDAIELLLSKIKNREVDAKTMVYKILKGCVMERNTQEALHQSAEALEKYDFAKADKLLSTLISTSTKENQ